jgi:hypothetical protein
MPSQHTNMPGCCRLYKNAILRRSKYAYTLPGYCSDRYTFAGLDEEVPKAPQNASYLHRFSKNLQLHVDEADEVSSGLIGGFRHLLDISEDRVITESCCI